jgi:hypothetical protein
MPRPLEKRKRPKPAAVTIKRVGATEPVEILSATQMAQRVEEVAEIRAITAVDLDVWAEQERLAPFLKLKRDDTILVPSYTDQMWWFVECVNGAERTITADTLLFSRRSEQTFEFSLVEPRPLRSRDEECEAAVALAELGRQRA